MYQALVVIDALVKARVGLHIALALHAFSDGCHRVIRRPHIRDLAGTDLVHLRQALGINWQRFGPR